MKSESDNLKKEMRELKSKISKIKGKKNSESVLSGLKKKVESKSITKKSKVSYTMPKRKVENVFHDDNKYFKGEYKHEKKLFFN